ncbi:diphosphomevalonate decarboxylase [Thermanaerothrix sp. 4228-RoL]|uniref:diphosphomevalonate decarboxylase n=1 Tax=Thermanaerothrix solaris TaxID=3058434 RepID=A0ABU3NNI2_9CHLR|nr:diphosphomevalonate decarboxylase [Thermanaerothrix sp. 4228-RoL]MDT8897910.1 diphosphomevalonate decarboxylase [Thermanaerothrix sp. 4228-RoL]
MQATALAHPNIAFIKYWGNRDPELRLPANGSLSMNLAGLMTRTRVQFDPTLAHDQIWLNGQFLEGRARDRVVQFLDLIRAWAGVALAARVESENNFPAGAGLASSAAAFAALALATTAALGLHLDEPTLSRLARRGSGSAARSVPGGFVEWQPGRGDADSYAFSIAPPEHWPLIDCVAVIEATHKAVGSSEGHRLAATSPLQSARVVDTPRRLRLARQAILRRDFEALAEVAEQDSMMMHAVMMTSHPPLIYWQGTSVDLMRAVTAWRREGVAAFYTLDAGPNVHVICLPQDAETVKARLKAFSGVKEVIVAGVGGAARLIETEA